MTPCTICEKPTDWPGDHPLHSTNWMLPDRRTFIVCSDECKQLLIQRYDYDVAVVLRRTAARTDRLRQKVINALEICLEPGLPDQQSDSDIRITWRNMLNALGDDSDE